MFTGIIEECGRVVAMDPTATGAVLRVRASFAGETSIGESVAVNGACLTVTEVVDGAMRFDLLHETLRVTNLGSLTTGSLVNLERSLRVGDRLSGHFVQGHVDVTTSVRAYEKHGSDYKLELALPKEFAHLLVSKGSLAVSGISLTIAELGESSVVLWIIPHTHAVTSLATLKARDLVNLEFDMLSKHIARLASFRQAVS